MIIDYNEIDRVLTGAYFYVPTETQLSYMTRIIGPDESEVLAFDDQTLWFIEKCHRGYVFGRSMTMLVPKETAGDGTNSVICQTNNLSGYAWDRHLLPTLRVPTPGLFHANHNTPTVCVWWRVRKRHVPSQELHVLYCATPNHEIPMPSTRVTVQDFFQAVSDCRDT